MGRRDVISVPAGLRPLLERPLDWPADAAWRISAAACRASGVVAWAACVEPSWGEPFWCDGRNPSRPSIIQSECTDALVSALERTPPGTQVEIVAPTSLRYLVEGARFAPGAPERSLWQLGRERRVWARYALGQLERPVAACLARAYASMAPLRWPGEAAIGADYVVYADGGCTPEACASAWVVRRGGALLVQTRPGATLEDVLDVAAHVESVDVGSH